MDCKETPPAISRSRIDLNDGDIDQLRRVGRDGGGVSWRACPAPARSLGDFGKVLRRDSLSNQDKAGQQTGAYQVRNIFQDAPLSGEATIVAGWPMHSARLSDTRRRKMA
jgi:hypothetical protein